MTRDTNNQDQKKRTMEALERRFALADAELRLEQNKNNKKRPLEQEDKGRVDNYIISSSTSNTPSKKGNVSFSGQTTARDAEANHPIYFPLSHPVHENLATTSLEVSVVDRILHELLQNGDSAEKYMRGSRRMKIENWILLDNLVQERSMSFSSRAKALQSHSKRSKKHMSMKQLKKCGSFDMPQELHNFEMFKPMHEMWKGYMTQLQKSVGKNQLPQSLLAADLHGAIILVAQCKIAAFTGLSGIMIRETAETFGIITQDNKFRVVLKKISIFMLQVDCWKITLHGDKLTSRKVGQ